MPLFKHPGKADEEKKIGGIRPLSDMSRDERVEEAAEERLSYLNFTEDVSKRVEEMREEKKKQEEESFIRTKNMLEDIEKEGEEIVKEQSEEIDKILSKTEYLDKVSLPDFTKGLKHGPHAPYTKEEVQKVLDRTRWAKPDDVKKAFDSLREEKLKDIVGEVDMSKEPKFHGVNRSGFIQVLEDDWFIEGYGVKWNEEQKGFIDREGLACIFRPGCFSESLKEKDDIKFMVEHNPMTILGRVGKNLKISSDNLGLRFCLKIVDKKNDDVYFNMVKNGLFDKCSIGYNTLIEQIDHEKKVRVVLKAELVEISLISEPGLPGTECWAKVGNLKADIFDNSKARL